MTTMKKRRALSPLLATVILLGVTVAAGGSVFALYDTSENLLGDINGAINVKDVDALANDSVSTLTFTIENNGDQAWDSIVVNGLKDEVPALIFYRPLNFQLTSTQDFSPSSPATVSAIIDTKPGDDNGGWIGLSNLIIYSTSDFAPFSLFSTSFEPSDLCTTNTADAAALSGLSPSGDICALDSFHGIKLDEPLRPGDSVTPVANLLTNVPSDVVQTATNQIDTIQTGDEILLDIIVTQTDGTQLTKTQSVRIR